MAAADVETVALHMVENEMTDMPQREEGDYDWARDSGPLYTFLGLYLAAFQWIEGKLDQIILLGAGPDAWEATQARLSAMLNYQKIAEVKVVVSEGERFTRVLALEGWLEFFNGVVDRLTNERHRRNTIMHSQYLLEGAEHGLAAIRSDRQRGNGETRFDQEAMTRDRMDEILREVAKLAFEVGRVHAQLVQVIDERGESCAGNAQS